MTKSGKSNKQEYYGETSQGSYIKGKVEANKRYADPYETLLQEMNYGNSDISPLLAAMVPSGQKVSLTFTPNYQFVRSGQLNNGLFYEDYGTQQQGTLWAIRYYFNNDKLVKIASATYKLNSNGSIESYNKFIAKIDEFTSNPDMTLLTLPNDLKDVTKRGK